MSCGCAEYEALERRQWLQAAGRLGALAMLSAPAWMPKFAFASGSPAPLERDLLIVVFLRGGADGLTLCVPFADPFYASSRGFLAIPAPDSAAPLRAIDLNGFFGLPPALASLKPIYDAGHLAVVHAAGNPSGVRSHFNDQDRMELATPTPTAGSSGWLARHLLSYSSAADRLRGITMNYSVARALAGAPAAVALPSDSYGLLGSTSTDVERREFLEQAYLRADPLLGTNAGYILTALNSLNNADWPNRGDQLAVSGFSDLGGSMSGDGMMSGMGSMSDDPAGTMLRTGAPAYPNNPWGRSFRMVADVAKAQVGMEAACIDLNGWDTHVGQGATAGYLHSIMITLGQCMEAFYLDMQAMLGRFTMVVMSEFGRQLAPNTSGGSDHGTGGAMFVMGGNVNGGQIFTSWPGLHPDQLNEQLDLAITTDYRDVLAEILVKRAGNISLPTVFPGFTPTFRGIIR
ncbi:MAG TPA: DUF1501 domain-containing protein [Phycisphaerae bacterium]|nr:DUF1501 domain-containing protein [Phycisphaerae bacterium]